MLHERVRQHKTPQQKSPQRCAIQHAHMKKRPVISAADYMQPVCETLQHAHVKHFQVNLF